jgi:hypothetical protein
MAHLGNMWLAGGSKDNVATKDNLESLGINLGSKINETNRLINILIQNINKQRGCKYVTDKSNPTEQSKPDTDNTTNPNPDNK